MKRRLGDIAYARSGDKGDSVNIGVIANTPNDYEWMNDHLTVERVGEYFNVLKPSHITRYELPNLGALNFVLEGVLGGGGTRSLRIDSQGKAFGQAILEMEI